MPLPLIEVLSALSTLLGTYQVVRNKSPGETPVAAPGLTSPGLMIAYELMRREVDDSLRALDSTRSRLLQLTAVAGLTLTGAPAIVALSDASPDLGSPLFLVPLGFFCFIAAVATVLRNLSLRPQASPFDLFERYVAEPDIDLTATVVRRTRAVYEQAERLNATGQVALLLLSVVLIAQLVVLGVWIPVEN